MGLVGFGIGSAPWWVYAIGNGYSQLVSELGGTAVAVEGTNFLQRSMAHLVNFVILGLPAAIGLRPPWEVRWLGLPLLPFVLIFWILVLGFIFRRSNKNELNHKSTYFILSGVLISLTLLFVLTPFGVDPSGRYFLPFIIPMSLGAAGFLLQLPIQRWVKAGIILLIITFNLWGTLDCALRQPPGITTQFYEPAQVDQSSMPELVQFLQDNEELTGYTNYWVAYPLAFLSDERIIFTPRLPYHLDMRFTRRDERYAPYARIVDQSDTIAYITTRNEELDRQLVIGFEKLDLTWEETTIGEFHVYYDLSRPVKPEEMGLGETTP